MRKEYAIEYVNNNRTIWEKYNSYDEATDRYNELGANEDISICVYYEDGRVYKY